MQMLILLFVAIVVGCLLVITVRTVNKYWCSSRRVFRPMPNKRANRSDHYVTSIIGGIIPPRTVPQGEIPVQPMATGLKWN